MKRDPWFRRFAVSCVLCALVSRGFAQSTSSLDGQELDLTTRLRTVEEELDALKARAPSSNSGRNKFLVTGFGYTDFTNLDGQTSTFTTAISPIILWQMGERLLFEAELTFELGYDDAEGGDTATDLEYADGSYLVNDNLTVGAGKFLTPFGIFAERLHPAWINKLPTMPLIAGHTGIVPFTSVGAYARGGCSCGAGGWNYAAYVSNGPRLNTGASEPDEAGLLHFDNYEDVNNDKAVGARVGYLPTSGVEIGASFITADAGPKGDMIGDARAQIYGLDLSCDRGVSDSGEVQVRGEWAWSDVEDVTYDKNGSLGFGPLMFDNQRNGGYLQVAYRQTTGGALDAYEPVIRYDMLDVPGGSPVPEDEERWTFGIDRWLGPSSVVKLAYQLDDKTNGGKSVEGFLAQVAFGF